MKNFLGTVLVLTKAQIRSRYRKTFAGLLWVVLSPSLTFMVHFMVFGHILKVQAGSYFSFLLSGLLPWIFLTTSLDMSINIFVSSSALLRAIKVHPLLILTSQVMDNAFNFLLVFVLLLSVYHFSSGAPIPGLLFLPLPFLLLVAAVTAVAFFMATLQVFYRDTLYLNQFLSSLMFFMTPLVYPLNMIPPFFRRLILLNPYYLLIRPFQVCIWDFDAQKLMEALLGSLTVLMISSLLAYYYWKKRNHEFYMHI